MAQQTLKEAAKAYAITIGNLDGSSEFDFIKGADFDCSSVASFDFSLVDPVSSVLDSTRLSLVLLTLDCSNCLVEEIGLLIVMTPLDRLTRATSVEKL